MCNTKLLDKTSPNAPFPSLASLGPRRLEHYMEERVGESGLVVCLGGLVSANKIEEREEVAFEKLRLIVMLQCHMS